MKGTKTVRLKIALMSALLLLSGCYWQKQVETSEVGLSMPDGVKVEAVVGAGRYTNLSFYAEMKEIDVSAKTIAWEDPDLVTRDKQPIGLNIGVTYARKRGKESVLRMWELYRGEAVSDEALAQQVRNRIPRIAKEVTTKYTLDGMLGVAEESAGRALVTQDLFDLLLPELAEVEIELLDVGLNNIAPSSRYLELLEEKANARVATEVAQERTTQLGEQLLQEQAQTLIEVEKAQRQNEVNEELSKVYEKSPQYYELERLKLLKDVIGSSDKVYFVPAGTDLTLILSGSEITPIKQD